MRYMMFVCVDPTAEKYVPEEDFWLVGSKAGASADFRWNASPWCPSLRTGSRDVWTAARECGPFASGRCISIQEQRDPTALQRTADTFKTRYTDSTWVRRRLCGRADEVA